MKSSYNRIYDKSPIWLQNILISLYGFKLYKQRYGKSYRAHYQEYVRKEYSSIRDETISQEKELVRFLNHTITKSPFYKDYYKNIDIASINNVGDLKILPILEKEVLRENTDKIFTIRPSEGIISYTGGTTGKSLMVVSTREDFQKRMAYLEAFKASLGVTKGMRRATFSGRQIITSKQKKKIFWRFNLALNQKLYSTFDMIPENMVYFVNDLNKFKPQAINGFVSAVYDLAKYIQASGSSLKFRPIAIFTTSESLLPFHRETIESVFSCRVFNQYSSAEGAPFICECYYGRMHYRMDTGVIEVLETNHGNEMLVTCFFTYGTPLVRYRIEDKIEWDGDSCPCGSKHPIVKRIDGRQVDYLLSKKCGKVSLSHLADVIKGMPNCIQNMQFVQQTVDNIDVKMVVDKSRYKSEYDALIISEMEYRFGPDTNINIHKVECIEKEKSGKTRLIINKLGEMR